MVIDSHLDMKSNEGSVHSFDGRLNSSGRSSDSVNTVTVSKIIAKPRVNIKTNGIYGRMQKTASTLPIQDRVSGDTDISATARNPTTITTRRSRAMNGGDVNDESALPRVSRSAPAGTTKRQGAHGTEFEAVDENEDTDCRPDDNNIEENANNSNDVEGFRSNISDTTLVKNKLKSSTNTSRTARATFHVRQHSNSMYNPNISIPTIQCLDGREFDICGRSLTSRSASDGRPEIKLSDLKQQQDLLENCEDVSESNQLPGEKEVVEHDSTTRIDRYDKSRIYASNTISDGSPYDSTMYNKQHQNYRFGDHRYQNYYQANNNNYNNNYNSIYESSSHLDLPGSISQQFSSSMLSEKSLDNIDSIIINSGSGRRSGIGFGNGTSPVSARGNLNNTKIALARQRLQKQKQKEKLEKKVLQKKKMNKHQSLPRPTLPLPLPRPS